MGKPPLHLGRPARILVTVLEEGIRDLIAEILAREGYDVVATASADEALRVAHASPDGLIILTYERDAARPGYAGWAAFTTARRPPDGHFVILLTADPATIKRRAVFHADEVLLLPFNVDDLLDLIKRTQRLFRTTDRGNRMK